MAPEEIASSERASAASAEIVGRAHESVVQVRARGRGAGAGVIWDQKGLVLTNQHVFAGRRSASKTSVVLLDGREFDAEVVKRGRDLDLALLRVETGSALPAAPVGDSDALRVGQLVYAIGHPWGRLGAVTAGVVCGLGVVGGPRERARYVQSDVSLAPGNSGGPLLNARGEVVGINSMIFGRLALSIPSNAASAWFANGQRPRLGVGILLVELPISLRGADATMPETGLMIAALQAGGPAERAGLLVGDVLLGAGDETPTDPQSLLDAIAGDSVRLRVMRGGKIYFVDVDLKASGRAA
jgi:serine protease Do